MSKKFDWRKLLNNRNPEEFAVWEIRGEDENADFAGPHLNPLLCVCEGTLGDVCKYATTLNSFFTWGSGGFIKKVVQNQVIKVDQALLDSAGFEDYDQKVEAIKEKEKKIARLEAELRDLKK